MYLSIQKHGHWKDYWLLLKAVVEKVYEKNLHVHLPYAPNPFGAGWTPYSTFNPLASYPPYTSTGPSNVPPHPPYPTKSHSSFPPNSPTERDQMHRSPSDDDNSLWYPSITEFFTELMETESNEHHFTNYTDAFHDNGYYCVDELTDKGLTMAHCHWTLFSLFFFSPFQPNFFTFLTVIHFFLMFIFLYFIMLMTRWQGHDMIGNGTPDYLLLTLAVGLPYDLLGYLVPKTVYLWLNHWILHWNSLSWPLCLPLIKVQDLPNLEQK